MLGKAATKLVHAAVDKLFNRLKHRFLGPKLVDKRLAIGYRHELSLPGLYENAVRDQGATPSNTTMHAILSVAEGYIEAQRERAKAQVVSGCNAALADARATSTETDLETVLGGQLVDQFSKITSDVHRIVDSEAQNGRSLGALEGIGRINAQAGIEDPVVYFVVVRDANVCKECMRLHMLENETTPRLWYLSEVGNGYHKKGDSNPKVRGLHPSCRCSLVTLMPGYGFSAAGMTDYVGPGHSEIEKQRKTTKSEDLDVLIERLHKHQLEPCVAIPLIKHETPADFDFSKLDQLSFTSPAQTSLDEMITRLRG